MISAVCQKLCIDTGDRLSTNARKVKYLVKGPLPEDAVFPNFQVGEGLGGEKELLLLFLLWVLWEN